MYVNSQMTKMFLLGSNDVDIVFFVAPIDAQSPTLDFSSLWKETLS